MSSDLPFTVEYAKSSRAGCKGCKQTIMKDDLRVGIMIQSPHFDGKIPLWHHSKCFWTKTKRQAVKTEADFHGFDNLRWDDQERIRGIISGTGAGAESVDTSAQGVTGEDFSVEYAKSSRSTCGGCAQKIPKGEIRLSRKNGEIKPGKSSGYDQWFHLTCFAEKAKEFGFSEPAQNVPGFAALTDGDQETVTLKLKPFLKRKQTAQNGEAKTDSNSQEPIKKQKTSKLTPQEEETLKLKEQSKALWEIKDKLQNTVHKKDMVVMLEENKQHVPSGESKIIERLADCMLFGPLKPCKECSSGQLVYSTTNNAYMCTGNISAYTKCEFSTQEPTRKKLVIPEELQAHEYLGIFKFKAGKKRFFPQNKPPPSAQAAQAPAESRVSNAGGGEKRPLSGLKFVISDASDNLKKSVPEVKDILRQLGAQVLSSVSPEVVAVVGSVGEVEDNNALIRKAKNAKNNVHVVDEAFLDSVISVSTEQGLCDLILKHSVAPWGTKKLLEKITTGQKAHKVAKSIPMISKDHEKFTKSVPKSQKVVVKGGAAVDADCEVAEVSHVFKDTKGTLYSQILNMVDIQSGGNSYYKLQLLQHDWKPSKWYIYRAWGRIGTNIGGNKIEPFNVLEDAKNEFKRLYLDKTGNDWSDRARFVKYPNKFFPVDVTYDEDEDMSKSNVETGSKSKLNKTVQNLIQMIFDVKLMKATLKEFDIDLQKMPLGKISKKQIKDAYTILTELQKELEAGASEIKIKDYSNRFYTLIPHDFGMEKPKPLDTLEVIKEKSDMLESMLEIQLAYSILKSEGGEGDSERDPIDLHYEKLATDIQPMDKKSEEFKRLVEYVNNTHAPTHTMYKLEVEEIFKVARNGERDRYAKWRQLHNRMLLWHGSRLSNYAGILSQGLRIAPPEAPVTGYMFGKGVYFADMVTKSANYCFTNNQSPTGFLLLCEVALGDMWELKNAQMITSLPEGKNSTKGMGLTSPDPKKNFMTEDGVCIPMGKGKQKNVSNASLLYNEYIVYDVNQINMKYLIQAKFNYNARGW